MKTIMLLNSKGGCGKTTIATNLCGYFATRGTKVALMDFDPQGSSLRWLKQRDQSGLPQVQGIDAATPQPGVTRSWQLRTEADTELLVIDTPAAFDRNQLLNYVNRAEIILVPVMPSHIDIHAAARFIQDLLLIAKVRRLNKRVGIIANRVRKNTLVYRSLERFLDQLDIPLIARLRDAQNYVQAAESGRGIHELLPSRSAGDRSNWWPLLEWLAQSGVTANHSILNSQNQSPLQRQPARLAAHLQ